jgi:hypothetical protein
VVEQRWIAGNPITPAKDFGHKILRPFSIKLIRVNGLKKTPGPFSPFRQILVVKEGKQRLIR